MRILLVLLALGCSRPAVTPADAGPPAMAPGEKERAGLLCTKYVERVCACAATDPSLRDTCDLAKGQPEAVRMHVDVLEGAPLADISGTGQVKEGPPKKRPPLNDNERRLTEASLRKVAAACVKLDAELEPARCPRK